MKVLTFNEKFVVACQNSAVLMLNYSLFIFVCHIDVKDVKDV